MKIFNGVEASDFIIYVSSTGNEADTEEHLKNIATREKGRLASELQRLDNELADLKDKKNTLENNIFRKTQMIDDMKTQMNWDQQALEAWLEEAARKDEDFMTLQKYTRQDESKIKETSLKIEKLTDEVAAKRRTLENETTETLTAQLALDKTAEEFRKAHSERQTLIGQWEQTIELMKRRDKEINELSIHLAEAKNSVYENEQLVKEKETFSQQEQENNEEKEKQIALKDRAIGKSRGDYSGLEKSRKEFSDELESLKNIVEKTGSQLENTRATISSLKKEIESMTQKLNGVKEERKALQDKLQLAVEGNLSAEQKANMMDQLLEKQETNVSELSKIIHTLHENLFRKQQELFKMNNLEKDLEAEISGGKTAAKNLAARIAKLDADTLKQQELIYNQDFTLQTLERRLWRMQGEVKSNAEEKALLAKVEELNEILVEKNQRHSLLSNQLKQLNEDMRRLKKEYEAGNREKIDLTDKIDELDLHNDTSAKVYKNMHKRRQDKMVEVGLLQLEVKRLRDLLNAKADDVMTLEKRRLWVDTALKERLEEINVHQGMLKAQIKAGEDERQTISVELHERIAKIDKLRKRYEILMTSMAPPEGEEERSAAYYVIKAAQEKEELQRKGDMLDAKIRKAEKEIRALENTLRLLNGRNETYRKSFNSVKDTSEVVEDKEKLEQQRRTVLDKVKYKRRQLREIQDDLHMMQTSLARVQQEDSGLKGLNEEKIKRIQMVQQEIVEQQEKISRAQKTVSREARSLRQSKQSSSQTIEERDFELRELRDFNRNVMKQIADIMVTNASAAPDILVMFRQAGLDAPPGSATSSRASSQLSSARSDQIPTGRSGAGSGPGTPKAVMSPKTVQIGLGDGPMGSPSGSRPPAKGSGSRTSSRASGGSKR